MILVSKLGFISYTIRYNDREKITAHSSTTFYPHMYALYSIDKLNINSTDILCWYKWNGHKHMCVYVEKNVHTKIYTFVWAFKDTLQRNSNTYIWSIIYHNLKYFVLVEHFKPCKHSCNPFLMIYCICSKRNNDWQYNNRTTFTLSILVCVVNNQKYEHIPHTRKFFVELNLPIENLGSWAGRSYLLWSKQPELDSQK